MPNTHNGVSDSELAAIYNCFDIYVQYSNCEGFGMPQLEAAFCGVPVASVDYSAMSSVLTNIGGTKIPIERMFWDAGTGAQRALPDNFKAKEIIGELCLMPSSILRRMGDLQRTKAMATYSYDKAAGVWDRAFEKVGVGNWEDKRALIKEPNLDIPPGLDNEQFINWCIVHVLGEPNRINTYEAMKWLKDLNYGEAIKGTAEIIFNEASFITTNQRHMRFTHKEFVENLVRMAEKRNYFERLRLGLLKEPKPYWIIRKKEANS